ncbi:MAG: GtrA family protein [Candidatus Methylumidiphilus sp.]
MSMQALIRRVPVSFWRFGLVGVGGLFVDMAVLYAAMWGAALGPVAAKVLSFLAAATFTWWMNRLFTFGHSGKSLLHEWASFLATNAFGGVVNFAAYTALVTQALPYAWMPALATAAGSLSGLLFNYTASRHIVFNAARRPQAHKVDSGERVRPLPKMAYALALAVGLGFGGLALWLGMDANWDLLNYHWHSGWAFVHGVVGRDLLVGQLASFYNPLLDAAYAFGAEQAPARAVGFTLGFLHGLNFLLLLAIGWRLSALAVPRHRLAFALATALAGVLGAGGLSEVGTVFYDNLLSLGVLASVWLVIAQWERLAHGQGFSYMTSAVAAGLPAGLAFGLKQPMVIYCVGLCAAFLAADMPLLRRIGVGFWFGVGVLLGFAAGGGHWAWHLWQAYGNPLFPYYNHVFRSPWALPMPYRDDHFIPGTLADKLLFAFRFSFAPRLVGEIDFRDFRILALVTLAPLAGLAWVWRRPAHPLTRPGPTGWLLVAGLATYAVWVPLFSIYRYLVPLEMLAPTLLFAAVGLLPLAEKTRRLAALGLLAGLAVATLPGNWGRVPWAERAAPIDGMAAIAAPPDTVVLLTSSSHGPMSFLIPAFPESFRFYRIGSTFTLPDNPDSGFRKIFREALQDNPGPVASLHILSERHEAVKRLAGYGRELDLPSCRLITSPISPNNDYAFCLTRKLP